MRWVTKEEYQRASNEYNNKMYYTGKFGTLEEQEILYREYMEAWENYKLTNACKKMLVIVVLALLSFIGYKFYTNTNGVEEVQSCSVTNTCNYKNQN